MGGSVSAISVQSLSCSVCSNINTQWLGKAEMNGDSPSNDSVFLLSPR